ncbi:MAG: TerD family protein [Synergistaceae bacterium]|nr:TerD family protein [Synergistaceae bacterium]
MSVSLKKGQKVDLTKDNSGLKSVVVGLGWDEAQPEAKGVFGGLFGGSRDKLQDIDCDAIAFLLDSNERIAQRSDVVFFNNLRHNSGCVTHHGDNLTGAGEGDDEQITVQLSKLPAQYERVVILVSIYKATERHQHFGMIRNAFIRLVDSDTNKELCIYNLSENYDGMTAMVFGELYRKNGEWKFNAVGQPLQVWSVADLAERYGLPRSVWH